MRIATISAPFQVLQTEISIASSSVLSCCTLVKRSGRMKILKLSLEIFPVEALGTITSIRPPAPLMYPDRFQTSAWEDRGHLQTGTREREREGEREREKERKREREKAQKAGFPPSLDTPRSSAENAKCAHKA